MENKTMPLLFLNLFGEMLYVLLQRLDAQNILLEKKVKVIEDILKTTLHAQFLQELFKPQKMYTRLAMQSVFEKLVHSSIMRLNKNSMKKTYKDLCHTDYECLYKCINAFLEDLNIRVSVLMKLGLQLSSGEIVVSKHCIHDSTSESEQYLKYENHNLEVSEENCFTLGTNIYTQPSLIESNSAVKLQSFSSENVVENEIRDCKNEELNLLTRLIGKCVPSNSIPEIMLASSPEEEKKDLLEKGAYPENSSVINIDASQISKKSLEEIDQQLLIKEVNDKFDILDLMDSEEITKTK